MALLATDSGSHDFELTPAGNHVGICYMVCDLGIQDTGFGPKRKVRVSWELPDEKMEDGRPFSISKAYTLSLNEKANLRKDLESWRGLAFNEEELQGFDLFALIGKPCMLNVIHETSRQNGNTFALMSAIGRLPKSMEAPPLTNDTVQFSLNDPANSVPFDNLPDWLQKKINRELPDTTQMVAESEAPTDDFDDDIPW